MAKNWQPKEAIELIAKKDTEALNDLGKRFPLFTAYASAALAGDVEGLKKFVEGIPNHISVRQMNTRMNQAAGGEGDSEDFEEKPKKKTTSKKAPAKTKGKKAPAKKSKKVEEDFEDFEDDFEDDDMGEEIDFDSMSPTELKAEAKKRKIKIAGMKKAQVIKALKESLEEDFEDEDDDDWGVDI